MKGRVKWGRVLSDTFAVTTGVQHGGVLSPLLFSIYIDDLLVKINRSGYGCSVGKVNIGAVAYADDICLLSGSSYGLQLLLHICSTFAVERHFLILLRQSVFVSSPVEHRGCQRCHYLS